MATRRSVLLAGRAHGIHSAIFSRSLVTTRPALRIYNGAGRIFFGGRTTAVRFTSSDADRASTNDSSGVTPVPSEVTADHTSSVLDAVAVNSDTLGVAAEAITVTALGYYPSDLVMRFVEYVHVSAGLPYWEAIVAITVGVRFLMIPVYIKVQQTTARMAVMKPEMDVLSKSYTENPRFKSDPALQSMYQQEMKALWTKHDVNPMRALSLPILQLPVFIAFFQGLRGMSDHFPGFKTGGTSFFTDLSVPDSTYILPILNAASFLVMIEMGGEAGAGNPEQQKTFKLAMRALGIVMIPATMAFSQVMRSFGHR